jgi:hypothetical protein
LDLGVSSYVRRMKEATRLKLAAEEAAANA